MSDTPAITVNPETWLGAELNHVWLLAEFNLRQFQRAHLRPQPDSPQMAEIEGIFAARRAARGASAAAPADENELLRALGDSQARRDELRKVSPIGRLGTGLGLRTMEIETLIVALAPHIDAPLADVLALLRGAQARRGVDLALIAQLFRLKRADRIALLDVVDPDRPLLSWRMVQVMPPESAEAYGSVMYRAIQPTFDVLSVLSERSDLSPTLSRCATLTRHAGNLDDLALDPPMRERLQRVCDGARHAEAQGRLDSWPWILLWGPRGIGKGELAGRMAGAAGRPLLMFNPNVGDRALFEDLIRRAQREALLRGAILYVGPMTLDFLADAGLNFAAAMSNYPGAAVLGVQTMQPPRLKLDHPVQEVELKLPTEPVRLELWQRAVPNPSPDVDLPKLARGFHMTPGEIADIAREANLIANNEDGRLVGHGDLRAGVERRLRNELGEMARKINVAPKWSDLVLSDEDMQRIKEFISRKLYADKVYNDWGFGDRIGYGRGIIALLSGPPGTGKTMLAGLIAKDLDLELYQVDLSIVVSKWIGETEKQLGKVFDQAERAHAVLLFDEADALFAKRTEVTTANDRYGNLAVNYLLQRLEQYTGIAVLTTNKEAVVDEALQRRLSLHLHMRVPEQPERERLWHSFLPDKAPRADDLDFSALSQDYELSGGYIKNAMVRAAFLSVSQDQPIGMDNLRRAAILELEDMGRLAMRLDPSVGGDKGSASSLTGDTVDFSEG